MFRVGSKVTAFQRSVWKRSTSPLLVAQEKCKQVALCSQNTQTLLQRHFASSSSVNKPPRPDPFARRPNKKCDPYGQGGKPLSTEDAQRLLSTLNDGWTLRQQDGSPVDANGNPSVIPTRLTRSFEHSDFMSGSSFLNHVAAVAQMNDHFPTLSLERKLDSRLKQWKVVSTVSCHTFVLEGLSHHDFFLATVRFLSYMSTTTTTAITTTCGRENMYLGRMIFMHPSSFCRVSI